MKNIKCKNNYLCFTNGIDNFSKISIGTSAILCGAITEDAKYCEYSVPYGDGYFCHCPLVKYLIEKYKNEC